LSGSIHKAAGAANHEFTADRRLDTFAPVVSRAGVVRSLLVAARFCESKSFHRLQNFARFAQHGLKPRSLGEPGCGPPPTAEA
jgi:hypothetical protein